MPSKASVIVVANRTADSSDLIAFLRRRSKRTPTRYTLLVPAVPHGLAWAADMKAGWSAAVLRAEAGARRMRGCGLDLERALIGDPDPFSAVCDALHRDRYDEVVVSTLPGGLSRWLKLSLPDRLRRVSEVPVSQVSAHPRPARREIPLRRPEGSEAGQGRELLDHRA